LPLEFRGSPAGVKANGDSGVIALVLIERLAQRFGSFAGTSGKERESDGSSTALGSWDLARQSGYGHGHTRREEWAKL
jgi:hypothetical protein